METLSKCRALVRVNAEITARCKAKPVLCCVAGEKGVLTLTWRWKPNVPKQLRKLEQVWEIGPFSLRSTEASAAIDALAGNEALLRQLQERLEEQHVALGKLENKCLAPNNAHGRLPLTIQHPYIERLYMRLHGEHAFKLAAFLLKAPETVVKDFAKRDLIAASWLAYHQFGQNTISMFQRTSVGIDIEHKEGGWEGVAYYQCTLYRFSFAELGEYEFGQLELESEKSPIETFQQQRTHGQYGYPIFLN